MLRIGSIYVNTASHWLHSSKHRLTLAPFMLALPHIGSIHLNTASHWLQLFKQVLQMSPSKHALPLGALI